MQLVGCRPRCPYSALVQMSNRPTSGRRSYGKHAQAREQIRSMLDLIQDDQPGKPPQGEHRIRQSCDCRGVLEIESGDRTIEGKRQCACQSRLAHLSSAKHPDDRITGQEVLKSLKVAWAPDDSPYGTVKIRFSEPKK